MADHLSNNRLFRSDQHLTEEGIAACAEALLDERVDDSLQALQAHVDQCETCRREVVELYSLIATMPPETHEKPEQEEPAQPSSPQNTPPRLHPAWRWTLVALTAVLAIWVYRLTQDTPPALPPGNHTPTPAPEQLLSPQQKNDRPIVESQTTDPKVQKQPQQDLYAANFIPSDQLEGLSGEVFRSNGLEVLSPALNQTFNPGAAVLFQWKQETNTALQLIVLDNRGKELFRQEVVASSFEWTAPKRPGLYYWKLENTEELLFTGKFLLK